MRLKYLLVIVLMVFVFGCNKLHKSQVYYGGIIYFGDGIYHMDDINKLHLTDLFSDTVSWIEVDTTLAVRAYRGYYEAINWFVIQHAQVPFYDYIYIIEYPTPDHGAWGHF